MRAAEETSRRRRAQRRAAKERRYQDRRDNTQRWKTILAAAALVATVAAAGIGAVATIVTTNRTSEVAVHAQLADQFTRAIDQLGDEKSESVRLGAVHALLRLVDEDTTGSLSYRQQIEAVLAPYVTHRLDLGRVQTKNDRVKVSSDVRAALEGLARHRNGGAMDLSRTNLRGMNLRGADLTRANLRWANLTKADLSGADLTGADLIKADLSGADLTGANLSSIKMDTTSIWPDGFTPPSTSSQ